MNKTALKKNEWTSIRIRPIAKRFWGENGPQLPPVDDDWSMQTVNEDGVRISNTHTGHATVLGFDQIHHYSTDPNRGQRYGVVTLNVQLHIGGNSLWTEPTIRPGQALPDQFENVRGWQRQHDPSYIASLFPKNQPSPPINQNWGSMFAAVLCVGLGFWLIADS